MSNPPLRIYTDVHGNRFSRRMCYLNLSVCDGDEPCEHQEKPDGTVECLECGLVLNVYKLTLGSSETNQEGEYHEH